MRKLKVQVLYEYGTNLRPHASASLRLIRPLSYFRLRDRVDVSFGHRLNNEAYDLVMVDRLWRPDIQPALVKDLAKEVHRKGAKLIYWLDDNFAFLKYEGPQAAVYQESFNAFLRYCDGLVVSTPELMKYFSNQKNLAHLPSALDEQLIARKLPTRISQKKITIGYMGTSTHDEDLRMVIPALQSIQEHLPGCVTFQIVGALNHEKLKTWDTLKSLPIQILEPLPFESEYQLFMLWFTGSVQWDLALAPLVDNEFNRYKSDIKFLDYTAAGAPGIFSHSYAYSGTVKPGETGLLVNNTLEDWTNAVQSLIDNPQLRLDLINNARDYLYEERILAKCWPDWLRVLEEAVEW